MWKLSKNTQIVYLKLLVDNPSFYNFNFHVHVLHRLSQNSVVRTHNLKYVHCIFIGLLCFLQWPFGKQFRKIEIYILFIYCENE